MQTDYSSAQNKLSQKWRALETRIANEDFERDTENMEKAITTSQAHLADIEKRIADMTTEREATSDRSDIIRLNVDIKIANSEKSTVTEGIAQMQADLAERKTEYKARLEEQAFSDQINALYVEQDTYYLAEQGAWNDIDRLW